MREQCAVIFWAWVCTAYGIVNPFAATGALVGCCFFLASPKATTLKQKFYLGCFSVGMGYAGGTFFYPGGPPWSEESMFVSGGIAALIATVATAAGLMIDSKGGLPKWVTDILGYVPVLKQRGDNDGN